MRYDYVPISQRSILRWPSGHRVAIITLNLETWDLIKDTERTYYAGGPSVLPDLLPGNVPDFPNYTWREYGQRVGVWRLFELFDELGVPVSCTANGATCERRKPMIDAAVARGWEIVAHNYEQGELLTDYAHEPEREREVIVRSEGLPACRWAPGSRLAVLVAARNAEHSEHSRQRRFAVLLRPDERRSAVPYRDRFRPNRLGAVFQ